MNLQSIPLPHSCKSYQYQWFTKLCRGGTISLSCWWYLLGVNRHLCIIPQENSFDITGDKTGTYRIKVEGEKKTDWINPMKNYKITHGTIPEWLHRFILVYDVVPLCFSGNFIHNLMGDNTCNQGWVVETWSILWSNLMITSLYVVWNSIFHLQVGWWKWFVI